MDEAVGTDAGALVAVGLPRDSLDIGEGVAVFSIDSFSVWIISAWPSTWLGVLEFSEINIAPRVTRKTVNRTGRRMS